MTYLIESYDPLKHKIVDSWILEDKYINAKQINEFAFFNEPISTNYKYILNNPYEMANIKSFIKVFKSDETIVGVVVFHYYTDNEKYYLGINPIVVNPDMVNQGVGKSMLNQIIKNSKIICGGEVNYIKALSEEKNIASIKLLETVGFKKEEVDKNFISYIFNIK
ncbi:MAG: GNAT family N-acetyltransferase [Acholeplasmataceae bacterium]|nr:GNAT family N-acetyltransferase [Acholeplasmataceae bacterium]